MLLLLLALLGCLFSATGVHAGSRLWQPSVSQAASLQRRVFVINPDLEDSGNDRVIWPNKQIRYCYENAETREKLKQDLAAAHKLWLANGLGSDFTFVEVGDKECVEKKNDVLLIAYTGSDGGMATYVGFPSKDSPLRRWEGVRFRPTMRLTDSTSMGNLAVVPNYAHELGHAWGLWHEHQNGHFWQSSGNSRIQNADNGEVFGPGNSGNWRCENLKDYNNFFGLTVQVPGGYMDIQRDELCKQYSLASSRGFTASDYLPIPAKWGVAHTSGKGVNDVDWNSIMLYPSGAGGRGDASLGSDNRLPILMHPNGNRIPVKEAPSQLDITAMRALYGSEKGDKTRTLLQKLGGNAGKSFSSLFSESKGQEGSGCL